MDTRSDPAAAPVAIPTNHPVWSRFFTVAPLVLVGTKEASGRYDLAPKHMATPLGWQSLYGFVCSRRHATLRNAVAHGAFTVSFPTPEQVVQASLAASGRQPGGAKPSLAALPTFPARAVDGVLVRDASHFLECELDRVVDGFDDASLVVGRIVAAAVSERALRFSERDDAELVHDSPLLVYLSPGRFATVSESFAFPYPADFAC
jgi:flavin reductase (DIM6/NTAB) family NADH-FMN oxidoreductase RutF